jgi:hypothetical protein
LPAHKEFNQDETIGDAAIRGEYSGLSISFFRNFSSFREFR